MEQARPANMCPHCGTAGAERKGNCSVCNRAVCSNCGNVQYAAGERKLVHRECLRKDGGGFKMIKFVR